jgi:RimJ/RimL family protein N-acetyltransferase
MNIYPLRLPIIVANGFMLRAFEEGDVESLQRSINNVDVARKVTNIPFPYTLKHAREWVRKTESWVTAESKRVDFAITMGNDVRGSVSFINIDGHKAQVSYWLAPDHWGEGIVPEALADLLSFGFDEMGLVRIYAYVYTENNKSARVLEKAGFLFEGVHRKEWRKMIDGAYQYFDSNYYAIVKEYV